MNQGAPLNGQLPLVLLVLVLVLLCCVCVVNPVIGQRTCRKECEVRRIREWGEDFQPTEIALRQSSNSSTAPRGPPRAMAGINRLRNIMDRLLIISTH